MFENKLINGIHVSRYFASWVRMCNKYQVRWCRKDFKDWLKSLEVDGEPLNDDDINYILNFSDNGKLELEIDASDYWFEERNYFEES